jgi:hypothetical protein
MFFSRPTESGAGAAASIDHLRRYIKLLFQPAMQKSKQPS